MDEDEEALIAMSNKGKSAATNRPRIDDTTDHSDIEHWGRPSSPEFGQALSPRRLGHHHDLSGHDITSFSEWSDGPASNTSIHLRSKTSVQQLPAGPSGQSPPSRDTGRPNEPGVLRDPERVVCNGYLQCLRIKGGVRQWKRLWVVLRPKSLGFYKDEQVCCLLNALVSTFSFSTGLGSTPLPIITVFLLPCENKSQFLTRINHNRNTPLLRSFPWLR